MALLLILQLTNKTFISVEYVKRLNIQNIALDAYTYVVTYVYRAVLRCSRWGLTRLVASFRGIQNILLANGFLSYGTA